MKIKYENRMVDLFKLNINRTFALTNVIAYFLFFLFATYLNYGMLKKKEYYEFAVWMFFSMAFLLLFSYIFSFFFIVIMTITKKNKSFLCEHELIFEEDCLIEKTIYNEGKHFFHSLYKMQETKNYFFIFISDYQAHIVPKKNISEIEIVKLREIILNYNRKFKENAKNC